MKNPNGQFGLTVLTLPLGWLLLATPVASQAQFNYTVTNQTVTITGYTGANGAVVIPDTITGLPVTTIGDFTFHYHTNLTSVTIPGNLSSIGYQAFFGCFGLTNVTLGNNVTNIGTYAFGGCRSLRSVTIPNRVINIGPGAFFECFNMTSVTIGNSVTNIGGGAFEDCFNLTSVYFRGNCPGVVADAFRAGIFGIDKATAYYLPGTTGWSSYFGGRIPTALWSLPYPLILNSSLGLRTNPFGFTVSWATNLNVVVEAATDVANPVWSPVQTNTLASGFFYFSDPQWTEYPSRFYRILSQ